MAVGGKEKPKLRVRAFWVLSVFVMLGIFAIPANATTGINQELSFEGKVVNSSGINIADGTYNMEFKIYTAAGSCNPSTGSGCTLGWTEDWLVSNSQGVSTTSGTFEVNLDSIAQNNFSGINWNSYPLYLSMQIGNTSSCTPAGNFQANCGGDGEMKPYILLTAAPYALNSNALGGLTSSQYVQLAQGLQTDTSTASSIYINKTGGSGNLLQLQAGGVDVLDLGYGGTMTVHTTGSDSTTAFQVQNHSNTPVLNVDTTNSQVQLRNLNDVGSIGSELFTGSGNYTFSPATNWTITNNSYGQTVVASTTGNGANLTATPAFSPSAGQVYQVTYSATVNAGSIRAKIGGVSGNQVTASQTQVDIIQATGSGNLTFIPSSNFNGSITSVSVMLISTQTPSLVVNDSTGSDATELRVSTQANGNLGLGYSALLANAGGTNNTAIGDLAGTSITAANNNTAVGNAALTNSTTGSGNTAIGAASLQKNLTGLNNVGVGFDALQLNTTGNQNAALGYAALQSNTTGASSTAVGYNALQSETTGGNDTAVGNNTLANVTIGQYNVGVGNAALRNIVSTFYNTAVGYQAGYQSTQTDFQTLASIGQTTIIGNRAQATCSNCTILGGQGSEAQTGGYGFGTPNPTNYMSVEPLEYNTGTVTTTGAPTTTVSGTGTAWTTSMIGSEIYIASNSTATATYKGTISGESGGNTLTVSPSVSFNISGAHYYILYLGLQVTSNGGVGVGTLSPSYSLDVQGGGNTVGINVTSTGTGGYYLNGANINNSGTLSDVAYLDRANNFTNTNQFSRNGTGTGDYTLAVTGTPINDATSSQIRLGNAISGGNTTMNGGTYIGLNEPSSGAGSAADFLNFQTNSISQLKVDNTGAITSGGATLTFSNAAAPTIQESQTNIGLNVTGNGSGTVAINTTGAGTVNLGTSNSTTIGIGNTGAGVTIEGSNAGTIAIGNGASAHTINIGGGSGTNNTTVAIASGVTGASNTAAVTIGSINAAGSNTTIRGGNGTNAITLQTASGGTITIGNSAAASIVNIANATGANNATVAIGNGVTGGSNTASVTIGSNNAAGSTTLIQGGNGSSAISLATAASGTVAIGNNGVNDTINLGHTGATANTSAVNIGTSTGAAQTIDIGGTSGPGNSNSGSAVNLQAGAVNLNESNSGLTEQTYTNSTTGFQIQNSSGTQLVDVDTTNSNLISNPSFEAGTTGWAGSGSGASVAQNTTTSQSYSGYDSLAVTLGGSGNTGTAVSSFVGGNPATGTYTLSFYARGSVSETLVNPNFGTGTCTLNSTSVSSTYFQRYWCIVTTTSATSSITILSSTNSATLYIDAVQLNSGSTVLPYSNGNFQLQGIVNSPATFQANSNSPTAFQVLNSGGTPLFVVDSTSSNLIGNPGFEEGLSGWSAAGNASIAQNSNKANVYHGQASLAITLNTTTPGATYTFGSTMATGNYDFSFWAMGSTNITLTNPTIGGTTCTLNSTTVTSSGFQHYSCTANAASTFTTITISSSTTSGTLYIDAVQLTSGTTLQPYQIGGVQIRGLVTNPLLMQATSNSTAALNLYNSSGSSLLNVDTLNNSLTFQTPTNYTQAFQVQNASGNNVFEVDTSNGRAGINVGGSGNTFSIHAAYGDGANTGVQDMVLLQDNYNNSFVRIGEGIDSSLPASGNLVFDLGADLSTNGDAAYYGLHYVSSGSANNAESFGLFGKDNLMNLYASSTSTGELAVNNQSTVGTAPATNLYVNGSWGGNAVVDARSDTTNQNLTESTAALVYHLTENSGTTAANITDTFNITGLPTSTDGVFAFIYTFAQKGATGSAQTTTVTVQIGGTQVGTVNTGSTTSATQKFHAFIVERSNGGWHILSAPSTTDLADLAEYIQTTGRMPQPGELLSLANGVTAQLPSTEYDQKVAGIVSTNPNTVYGTETPSSVPMVLAGRIPTIVTSLTGDVQSGDTIVSSPIPGVGMIPQKAAESVAKAMEDFSPTSMACVPALSYDSIQWPSDDGTNSAHPCFSVPVSSFNLSIQHTLEIEYGLSPLDNVYVGKVMALANLSYTVPDDSSSIGASLQSTQLGSTPVSDLTTVKNSFTIQNTEGTDLFVADTDKMQINLASLKVTGNLTVGGHIVSEGSAPTIIADDAACTNSKVSIEGNDTDGTITLTAGSQCKNPGVLATITFTKAFDKTPRVMLTSGDAQSSELPIFRTSAPDHFSISSPAVLRDNTTYTFDYFIIQ